MSRASQQDGKASADNTQGVSSARKRHTSGELDSTRRQSPGINPLRSTSSSAWPLSPASLAKLDHAKRTAMEAQEYRTTLRITELRQGAKRNDAVTEDDQEGGSAGIETDLPARVSPFVPNTAARRNITMRKSRDRLNDDVALRTPDDVTKRRSYRREKDIKYENEMSFQGASAVSFSRRHGEEIYRDVEGGSVILPDGKERGLLRHVADRRAPDKDPFCQPFGDYLQGNEARVLNSFLLDSARRNDTRSGFGISPAQREVLPGNSPDDDNHKADESSGDVESKDNEDLLSPRKGEATPLFLRRDIPSIDEDEATHDALIKLWDERQQASLALVQALDEDEPTLFEEIENKMRQINKKMHDILDRFKAKGGNPYLSVDDLPLVEPTSLLKQAFKSSDEGHFQIILDYEGNQIIRKANPMTSTKVVYHWAQQYLREAFSLHVPEIAYLLLLYENKVLPTEGRLEDVPVFGGAELTIVYLGKQRLGSGSTLDSSSHHYASTVDYTGQRGEESRHGLYHARAQSQPGNNGRAWSTLDPFLHHHASTVGHAGQQGEESHGLYHARAPSQPGNNGGALPSVDRAGKHEAVLQRDEASRGSGSYDKIRQAFKCPKFSGQSREWKQWHKGFMRYLSIWDLEYVLYPEFFDDIPLSPTKIRDNKMVYYIIEDAVQNSAMASSFVREASANNGFEAYYTLHDGYVFAGATTSTLLLNELSNFRFLPNETPTALCLRLGELFQELELLPGEAAVSFIDTQKIGYLLNALRHEEEWSNVTSHITSAQIKGTITFREACEELKVRCEVARVHDMMDHPVKGGKKVKGLGAKVKDSSSGKDDLEEMTEQLSEKVFGMISTMVKRQNAAGAEESPEIKH